MDELNWNTNFNLNLASKELDDTFWNDGLNQSLNRSLINLAEKKDSNKIFQYIWQNKVHKENVSYFFPWLGHFPMRIPWLYTYTT